MLARAFVDNPLNVAVIRGDARKRLRCNRAGMQMLLPGAMRHARVLTVGAGSLEGAMLALPPFTYPLPAAGFALQMRSLLVQGMGVRVRWGQVFDHLDTRHPTEPHWYLSTLGVAPQARRRGLGRELLLGLASLIEQDPAPCYLETDRPENLAFYEPAGFRVIDESRVLGVPIWHMRRP